MLAPEVADKVVARFKELGYTYVSLDLAGYKSGSMNAGIAAAGRGQPGAWVGKWVIWGPEPTQASGAVGRYRGRWNSEPAFAQRCAAPA